MTSSLICRICGHYACGCRGGRGAGDKSPEPKLPPAKTYIAPPLAVLLESKQFRLAVNDACQYKRFADKGVFAMARADIGGGCIGRYVATSREEAYNHDLVAACIRRDGVWIIKDLYGATQTVELVIKKERDMVFG